MQKPSTSLVPEAGGIWIAGALLLLLTLALFHRALVFVPEDGDDLRLLSSVAHTSQPLKWFVGDWGAAPYENGGHGLYRPLHPMSLWIVYKLVGIRAFPNQLINLALHFTNAILLLLIIWRVQKDVILAFMGASLLLISVHTMSPAIWVSDRASLQVGLALLLFLHHLVRVHETRQEIRSGYVFLLCLLALLSKESGVIVPLLAIVASLQRPEVPIGRRIRSGAIWIAVIGLYLAARFAMFGVHAGSHDAFGYLFGVKWYVSRAVLSPGLQKLVLIDNVVKNIVEVFLPVFSNEGGLRGLSMGAVLPIGLGALATAALTALSIKRKLTWLQVDCLWIVFFNAVIHSTIFRYRILYTAQIAICLFIACAPALEDFRRRRTALAMALLLLIVSTVRVDNYVQREYLTRYNDLNHNKLAIVLHTSAGQRVDPQIAKQILEKYRDPIYY